MKRRFVLVAAFVSLTGFTRQSTVPNAFGSENVLASAAQADPATNTVYVITNLGSTPGCRSWFARGKSCR